MKKKGYAIKLTSGTKKFTSSNRKTNIPRLALGTKKEADFILKKVRKELAKKSNKKKQLEAELIRV